MKLSLNLMLLLLFFPLFIAAQTRVVCVGNSVTAGYTLSNPNVESWPARLGVMLGSKYVVYNCGVSGTTMLKRASSSYWNTSRFNDAKNYNPDILIIALGTNDAHPDNWIYKNDFYNDYADMIDAFRQNGKNPAIYVCYPVACYGDNAQISNLQNEVIPYITQISTAKNASIINFNSPTQNQRSSLYNDNLHPNVNGALLLANVAFNTIMPAVPTFFRDCNYGGNAVKLGIGDYNFSALSAKGIYNDDISSIKVPSGYKVFGYVDDNFTGNYVTLTSDNSCLGGWDNLITSIRVRANGVAGKNGTYSIQNRNSGKYLDVAGGNSADGANILQWKGTGNSNQQFTLTDVGDGAYKLINVASGKAMDVSGVSNNNTANVLQWSYGGGLNQRYILIATDNGYYKLKAAHSGRLVEVFGAGKTDGDNVDQFDDNNQNNGQWKLTTPGSTQASLKSGGNGVLSIDPESLESQIYLYPNPASKEITVKNLHSNVTVTLFDLNGRTIRELKSTHQGEATFDVSNLQPSTYFVRIGNDQQITLKWIKQ